MAKLKVEVEIQGAYDTQEAATILGVGIATIWRWIANGKLASFKLAGRTLVPATSIKEVESHRQDGELPGQESSLDNGGER